MSNKELKPCPFCGGEADIHTYEDMLTDKNYTEVVCGYCGVGTKGDTQSEAIEAWNTRNYLEKQDSSKELMEFVKFCRNAYATDVLKREIEERKRTKKSYNLTPTEIQFITNRLEELIEEWGAPYVVFMAYKILRKLERKDLK